MYYVTKYDSETIIARIKSIVSAPGEVDFNSRYDGWAKNNRFFICRRWHGYQVGIGTPNEGIEGHYKVLNDRTRIKVAFKRSPNAAISFVFAYIAIPVIFGLYMVMERFSAEAAFRGLGFAAIYAGVIFAHKRIQRHSAKQTLEDVLKLLKAVPETGSSSSSNSQ